MAMTHTPIDWASFTDDEYLAKAEQQLWLSAFAANNPRAPAHAETDAAYAESKRRGKPWLYQRAWNSSYVSCGYVPTASDRKAAMEPTQENVQPGALSD
jgi:hypothetical protein